MRFVNMEELCVQYEKTPNELAGIFADLCCMLLAGFEKVDETGSDSMALPFSSLERADDYYEVYRGGTTDLLMSMSNGKALKVWKDTENGVLDISKGARWNEMMEVFNKLRYSAKSGPAVEAMIEAHRADMHGRVETLRNGKVIGTTPLNQKEKDLN